MKNKNLMSLVGAVALSLFSGAGYAATVTVTMGNDMKFTPDLVTIHVGDVVEFVNQSDFPHTVTADPKLAKDPANVILPPSAIPFNSGRLAKGGKFTQSFIVEGNYQYLCLFHEKMGMFGRVEVLPAASNEETKGFECDVYSRANGVDSVVKLKSQPEGKYHLINEDVNLAGRGYHFYVYYDGKYSSINVNHGDEEYYNTDAEVVAGNLFSIHVRSAALKPELESFSTSCHGLK